MITVLGENKVAPFKRVPTKPTKPIRLIVKVVVEDDGQFGLDDVEYADEESKRLDYDAAGEGEGVRLTIDWAREFIADIGVDYYLKEPSYFEHGMPRVFEDGDEFWFFGTMRGGVRYCPYQGDWDSDEEFEVSETYKVVSETSILTPYRKIGQNTRVEGRCVGLKLV